MNQNLTEVVFIIDCSGSMCGLVDDTIGGFNSLIEEQKKDNTGEVKVTTVLFNHNYCMFHNCVDIRNILPMTRENYCTWGSTAMLDAVGRTIDSVGERLAATPEELRPGKVLFVITTDGYENSSVRYSLSQVKDMIKHQTEKYSWTFLFLGANIDAVAAATSMGISSSHSHGYTASDVGTRSVYTAVNNVVTSARNCTLDETTITANLSSVE